MSVNNFKKIAEEQEAEYGAPPDFIENRIIQTAGFFTFAGNIIEVYLPKFFDLFVAMIGGRSSNYSKENRTPDRGGDNGERSAP